MTLGRVLLLSASAGAGHVRAADALERAIKSDYGKSRYGVTEVEHIDVLKFTNKMFRHLYSQAYLDLVNRAPEVLGWLYDAFDQPYKNERLRVAWNRLNTGPFVRFLKRFRPDVAICTHFLPSEILSSLEDRAESGPLNAVVVTDLDVHAMWLCRNADLYCVALEETRVHLEALGVPSNRVTVTGIPIDPVFTLPKDRAELQRKHDLQPGIFTVLVSAGGFGVGPIRNLVESIRRLSFPCQVVVICGRNEELRAELEQASDRGGNGGNVRIHPRGYTTEIDEFMSCADLYVGKPGGLTSSELLAKGVPLMIVNPIPGQEERNSDHLLEEGVAFRCNNLPALAYKIERLAASPEKLADMRSRAERFSKPRAAEAVLDAVLAKRG